MTYGKGAVCSGAGMVLDLEDVEAPAVDFGSPASVADSPEARARFLAGLSMAEGYQSLLEVLPRLVGPRVQLYYDHADRHGHSQVEMARSSELTGTGGFGIIPVHIARNDCILMKEGSSHSRSGCRTWSHGLTIRCPPERRRNVLH